MAREEIAAEAGRIEEDEEADATGTPVNKRTRHLPTGCYSHKAIAT